MIERLYLKNHLSFERCDVAFSKGLIVFTGPSGAGKSVLMQALLSVFGHTEVLAQSIECVIDSPLDLEAFGFEKEDIAVFKCLKEKSTRYFINNQSSSKKTMLDISRTFLNYLSLKDSGEFESTKLLRLLDGVCASKDAFHVNNVEAFGALYASYIADFEALERLEAEEKKIEELKEFARFEIAKIEEISPKIGEDEALLQFKKSLSKKEKLETALNTASIIFEQETRVIEALHLMEKESAFFDECMNELRNLFENERQKLGELDDINVEEMLDRIEKIAGLKKRYGSIEETLEHLQKKRSELVRYENLSFEKEALQKAVRHKKTLLDEQGALLHATRTKYLPLMEETLNAYLKELYMPSVHVWLEEAHVSEQGYDTLHINLGKVDVKRISSGEYNRLRLALLATYNAFLLSRGGVLILDEIDANLSGKESMSVANVLKTLSKTYQIFAISHQPQLSSCADQHFFVSKDTLHVSHVKALDEEERIRELARMVSGEAISAEAVHFAKSLRESNLS